MTGHSMQEPPVKAGPQEESPTDAAAGISAALIFLVGEAERYRLHKVATLIERAARQADLDS
jgi:hypothetical protein